MILLVISKLQKFPEIMNLGTPHITHVHLTFLYNFPVYYIDIDFRKIISVINVPFKNKFTFPNLVILQYMWFWKFFVEI